MNDNNIEEIGLDDDYIIHKRREKIHEAFEFWKNISSHSNSSPSLNVKRRSSAIFKDVRSNNKDCYESALRNRANTSIQLNTFRDFHSINKILKDSKENVTDKHDGSSQEKITPENDEKNKTTEIIEKKKDDSKKNDTDIQFNNDITVADNETKEKVSENKDLDDRYENELNKEGGVSIPQINILFEDNGDTDSINKNKSNSKTNESSKNLFVKSHRRNVSDSGEKKGKNVTKRRSHSVYEQLNEYSDMKDDIKSNNEKKSKSNDSKDLLDIKSGTKSKEKANIAPINKSKSSDGDISIKSKSKRNSYSGGNINNQERKPVLSRHSIALDNIPQTLELKRQFATEVNKASNVLESFFKNRHHHPSFKTKTYQTFGIPLDICVTLGNEAPEFVINATNNLLESADSIDWKDTFESDDMTYKDLMVIKKSIDSNSMDIREEKDLKIVANALLLFFNELKEPLCTSRHFNSFLYLNEVNDEKYKFRLAHSLLHSIPASNRSTLRYMVKFIGQLSSGNEKKQKKLCQFFAPSFIRLREEISVGSNFQRYSTSSVGYPLVKSSSESNMRRRKSDRRLSDKPRRKHIILVSKVLNYIVSNRNDLFKLAFDDKIFAWSKGHLYVEAASLDGMLELLTDELYIDNDFPNIFFLNSTWLIDPIKLFKKIMNIYELCSVRRRARILMILKLWFKTHGRSLVTNEKFFSKVSKRVEKYNETKEEGLFWNDLLNTLKMHKQVPIEPEPQKSTTSSIFDFDIFDYDPKEIARAITLIDVKNFKAIRPEECLQKAFCDENRGPNFFRMASSFNKLNLWVQTCIINTKSKKDRASLIIFFTSIMTELIELQNFNGSLAIFSALTSTGLSKLTKTWSKVGRKFIKVLENAEELFSMRKNYRNYRLKLKECNLPAIPQIAYIARNLFAIEENMETKINNNMINVEKMRSTYNIIKEIQKFQKSEYNFERVETLISKFDNLECKTEEDILEICQTLEMKK